jgi:hypothetical protein
VELFYSVDFVESLSDVDIFSSQFSFGSGITSCGIVAVFIAVVHERSWISSQRVTLTKWPVGNSRIHSGVCARVKTGIESWVTCSGEPARVTSSGEPARVESRVTSAGEESHIHFSVVTILAAGCRRRSKSQENAGRDYNQDPCCVLK